MDRLESLTSTLSNITMYDIKSMYNQAKNVVLNVSEMEAKVREATNDDPWGASSTLMQDIAQGTFHFQYFNEIMPAIYSRFMEKEASQWRQIYKALQLLEYLIKHGSERVVDDARSHVSTLKMLRNFHYIDDKGKDEGINVRNRSKELVELLSDVEKIRAERRKAKANKNKYIGVGNDGFAGGMSFESGGGGRYGGFGSDSLGGGSSSGSYGNYSNGSSSRGGGRSSFSDNRRQFEEYNAGDDEVTHTPVRSNSVRSVTTPVRKATAPPPPKAAPAPVVNLLDFDDDPFGSAAPAPVAAPAPPLATNKALPAVSNPVSLDDDEFDDFQVAPVQTTLTGGPTPVSAAPAPATQRTNLAAMLNTVSPQQSQFQNPAFGMGMGSGMGGAMAPTMGAMGGGHRQNPSLSTPGFGSAMMNPQQPSQNLFGGAAAAAMRPTQMGMAPPSYSSPGSMMGGGAKPAAAAPAKSANFDDLWDLSLGSTGAKPATGGASGAGKSIKDLEKEKAMAGLWGNQGQRPAGGIPQPAAFGAYGNAAPPSSSSGGGGVDDLLF